MDIRGAPASAIAHARTTVLAGRPRAHFIGGADFAVGVIVVD